VWAAKWWHEFMISLQIIWGWLRIPRSRPLPEIHTAVRYYVQRVAGSLSRLPAGRARKHLLALADIVARDGWPSVAAEVVRQHSSIVLREHEAYFQWRCGDIEGAYRIIAESLSLSHTVPQWAILLITSSLLQRRGECHLLDNGQSLLPPHICRFITQAKRSLEDLGQQRNALDLLDASRQCPTDMRQWAAEVVMRYGHINLVSPDDLSQEGAALWYLLNGKLSRSRQIARQALTNDMSRASPRLILASLYIPDRPNKARSVSEYLLFPELTHGFVSSERDVAKKLAKVIWEDGSPSYLDKEIDGAVQICMWQHDVGLLHLIAHIAWYAKRSFWSEYILNLFDEWGVVEYPMLRSWRISGKPITLC
jgi:hypothetical protein